METRLLKSKLISELQGENMQNIVLFFNDFQKAKRSLYTLCTCTYLTHSYKHTST